MANDKSYKGSCFCGAVEIVATGDPAAMGYCHCASCRKWAAAPINAFTLWPTTAVKVTKGGDMLRSFNKTPKSERMWCSACGGHVMTKHPQWNLIDVYAATVPEFPFKAGVHVNYQESVAKMRDGLPKMKDLPAEMGGSGATIAE
jgi:hypothetical protein